MRVNQLAMPTLVVLPHAFMVPFGSSATASASADIVLVLRLLKSRIRGPLVRQNSCLSSTVLTYDM